MIICQKTKLFFFQRNTMSQLYWNRVCTLYYNILLLLNRQIPQLYGIWKCIYFIIVLSQQIPQTVPLNHYYAQNIPATNCRMDFFSMHSGYGEGFFPLIQQAIGVCYVCAYIFQDCLLKIILVLKKKTNNKYPSPCSKIVLIRKK